MLELLTASNLSSSNILNDTDGTIKLCDYVVTIFLHYFEKIVLGD